MDKFEVFTPGCREKFECWIATRGGVKAWRNIDLSNCGAGPIFTPAMQEVEVPLEHGGLNMIPYPKPSWRVDNGEVVMDITRFRFVKGFKELKRIRVALKRSSGLNFCLTDGSQRKLDHALEKAREKYDDVVYRKDGGLFSEERYIVVEAPEWED